MSVSVRLKDNEEGIMVKLLVDKYTMLKIPFERFDTVDDLLNASPLELQIGRTLLAQCNETSENSVILSYVRVLSSIEFC